MCNYCRLGITDPVAAEAHRGRAIVAPMTTFLGSDDSAKSRRARDLDRLGCFLHLRDLVYRHPEAAPASAVSVVRALEVKIVASKAARLQPKH
jgi:hypothetical protein